MYEWIILLALVVALLSSGGVWLVVECCRRRERERNRGLLQAIREQDRLARELEHARIKNQALERVLAAKLPAREAEAADENAPGTPNESHL